MIESSNVLHQIAFVHSVRFIHSQWKSKQSWLHTFRACIAIEGSGDENDCWFFLSPTTKLNKQINKLSDSCKSTYLTLKARRVYKFHISGHLGTKITHCLFPVEETAAFQSNVSRKFIQKNFIWYDTCYREICTIVVINLKRCVGFNVCLTTLCYYDRQVISARNIINPGLKLTLRMREIF